MSPVECKRHEDRSAGVAALTRRCHARAGCGRSTPRRRRRGVRAAGGAPRARQPGTGQRWSRRPSHPLGQASSGSSTGKMNDVISTAPRRPKTAQGRLVLQTTSWDKNPGRPDPDRPAPLGCPRSTNRWPPGAAARHLTRNCARSKMHRVEARHEVDRPIHQGSCSASQRSTVLPSAPRRSRLASMAWLRSAARTHDLSGSTRRNSCV